MTDATTIGALISVWPLPTLTSRVWWLAPCTSRALILLAYRLARRESRATRKNLPLSSVRVTGKSYMDADRARRIFAAPGHWQRISTGSCQASDPRRSSHPPERASLRSASQCSCLHASRKRPLPSLPPASPRGYLGDLPPGSAY